MNPEIAKLIDELAKKLGTTAEYLWGVLLREAKLEGGLDIAVGVGFAALAVYMTKLAFRGFRDEFDEYDSNPKALVVGSVIATIATIIATVSVYSGITELFNPGYFALNKILSAVK